MFRPYMIGEKIYLRGLDRADLEHYYGWMNDWDVTQFMETGDRPANARQLERMYDSLVDDPNNIVFTMVDRKRDVPVGSCGLYLIQWVCRRAEFRIIIGDKTVWDRGFGSEAAQMVVRYGFDRLNLEVIYLGVNAENARGIKSYENAGFVREGIRRRLIYRNSRYYDVVMMSIVREEFLKSSLYR